MKLNKWLKQSKNWVKLLNFPSCVIQQLINVFLHPVLGVSSVAAPRIIIFSCFAFQIEWSPCSLHDIEVGHHKTKCWQIAVSHNNGHCSQVNSFFLFVFVRWFPAWSVVMVCSHFIYLVVLTLACITVKQQNGGEPPETGKCFCAAKRNSQKKTNTLL